MRGNIVLIVSMTLSAAIGVLGPNAARVARCAVYIVREDEKPAPEADGRPAASRAPRPPATEAPSTTPSGGHSTASTSRWSPAADA